jgi:arsenate reductase
MAEGYLRTLSGDRFEVVSAGIGPGTLNPIAVEAVRDAGIDISHQEPKSVTDSLKEYFAYVITVCDMARERAPIFPFTPNLVHWSLEDPASAKGSAKEIKPAVLRVRDAIQEKVKALADELSKEHPEWSKAAAG